MLTRTDIFPKGDRLTCKQRHICQGRSPCLQELTYFLKAIARRYRLDMIGIIQLKRATIQLVLC
ncbi:MAG: hypothetical protein ACREPR_25110 [Brasilonema sp.]